MICQSKLLLKKHMKFWTEPLWGTENEEAEKYGENSFRSQFCTNNLFIAISAEHSIFGDTVYSCYCKLRLVIPLWFWQP